MSQGFIQSTINLAASALTGTTLASNVVTSSLTTVGALNSGSITSGFGNIDNGASTLDTGALTATTGTFSGNIDVGNNAIHSVTQVFRDASNASLHLGGGSNVSVGANLILYGESHASIADNVYFRHDTTTILRYNATSWTFGSLAVAMGALTATTANFSGDVIAQDQVTIGGSIEAGSIFNIEPGVAARDILTSVGTGLHIEADAQAINAAGNGETVAIGALAFLGIPTWTSVGTTFTISDATTLYIQGPPVDSTNVTHTREYALWVDDGVSRFDGLVETPATAAASAGINLPHGTVPTAPVDGDMWTTTAGLFVRINGGTVGPLS